MSPSLKALGAVLGTLAIAFGLVCLPIPAPAQKQAHNPSQLYVYTVATRPTSVAPGYLAYITDCESSSACAVGGGTNKLINVYNGASWDVAGGGGGATSCAGDLSGTYPNCVVVKVNGLAIVLSKGMVGTNSSGQFIDNTTAGGDLSGSFPSPTVAKVNGLTIPVSAGLVATNSSRQFTAVTTPLSTALGGTGTTGGPMNTIFASVITGAIGAAGDDFIAPGSNTISATLNQRAWIMTNTCTAENVVVGTTNAQPSTGSLVFTLWDLGTNAAALTTSSPAVAVDTITIPANGAAGAWNGSGTTRSIGSNHFMTLEVKNNASAASANFFTWGFQCQ